jgi:hypothetical protein
MELQVMTRREAQERGLKRFYTGVQCFRGHVAERYTCNGGCVDCLNFKTPKRPGSNSSMTFLPAKGFSFAGFIDGALPTPIEAQAAFRLMAHGNWHLEALKQLRANPKLMARYDHEATIADQIAMNEGRL